MPFQGGWIASLSNGETVFETEEVNGLSAWQALRKRCEEEGLHITMIRVQRNGVTLHGLPKADGYMQCYEMRKSMNTGIVTLKQAVGSVVGDFVVKTWIDGSNNVMQEIDLLKSNLVHVVMRNKVTGD